MTTNNTKANTCETMEITFRSKFEKLLNDGNRAAITSAFQKFCNLCPDIATAYLWHMTYSEDISGICQVLGFDIPQESISAFRNEFRHQYEQRHPGFLNLDVPSSCLPAFEALKDKTDAIVANIVFDYCIEHTHLDAGTMQHSLDLLSSEMENRYFGGIRNLSSRLKFTEAKYLKPFHTQIHDLLKALYEDKCQNEVPSGNLPFANLGERIKEAGIKLVPHAVPTSEQKPEHHAYDSTPAVEVALSTPCEEAADSDTFANNGVGIPIPTIPCEEVPESNVATELNPNTGFASLNASQILRYQEHFNALLSSEAMASLAILRDSGFDLNEIIDKAEKISSLLQVSADLIA